jgi:hypothetical protein
MTTLEDACAAARLSQTGRRMLKFTHDGQLYWIKLSGSGKKKSLLQRGFHLLGRILPGGIFRASAAADGADALAREAARMRQWQQHGLNVPDIVLQEDGWFATRDTGPALPDYLAQAGAGETYDLLQQALDGLTTAHGHGLCHGRPMLKDMTRSQDARVFMLDFEEDPLSTTALEQAAAQDILIFLLSCTRHAAASDIQRLYRRALGASSPPVARHLRRTIRMIYWPARVLAPLRGKTLGRDITAAIDLALMLRNIDVMNTK